MSLQNFDVVYQDSHGNRLCALDLSARLAAELGKSLGDIFCELDNLDLEVKPPIIMYGRICSQHRDMGFYSDVSGSSYDYAPRTGKNDLDPNVTARYKASTRARPMTPLLARLNEMVNAVLGTRFNGVLVNRFNDGSQYIGKHSDTLDAGLERQVVAEISFGATRKFRVREKATNKIVIDYLLKPGVLLWMDGDTFQKLYTHEIPIERRVKSGRISLTFRQHTSSTPATETSAGTTRGAAIGDGLGLAARNSAAKAVHAEVDVSVDDGVNEENILSILLSETTADELAGFDEFAYSPKMIFPGATFRPYPGGSF